MKQKKTVGQWSKELIEKSDDRHSVEEQMREQLSDLIKNYIDALMIINKNTKPDSI